MNKRTKSFLLSILTLSFIFYSCSNLANDLQKRKNQNLFNITIQETSNGTVTVAKSSGIKAGEEVILTVTATTGYELKTISVTNTQNKDVAVAAMEQGTSYKFTMPASDVTVGAAFDKTGPVDITEPGDLNNSSGDTVYKIEHCQQTLNDSGIYDLVAIQYKRGNSGDQTNAVSSDFPGFTALAFDQQTINSNGNTIVRIYYDRNVITYTIKLHGGYWEGSEDTVVLSGLYGATVNKPSRVGYHLYPTVPDIFGPEDVIYNPYWYANSDTPYKVRIYLQNLEGGNNYTFDEEITKKGYTDENTNYTAASKTGFYACSFNQVNINGDESTILNVYYNRKTYTVTFVTNGGNSMANQKFLYQTSPTQIPIKENCTFYNWYTDSSCNNVFDSNIGITSDITLYAFWIDNTITYRFHETVERLPAGTDGTFGTTGEYVLFGDYPQSLLTGNTITVDESRTRKINNITVYGGSDKNWYYKKDSKYFKIEPIKWRVISRDENDIAVLFAEDVLEISAYGYDENDYVYTYSLIHNFLNNEFLSNAFTVSAQNIIKNTTIDCDTFYYDDHGHGEFLDYYSNDKIYLLKYLETQDSSIFPTNSSLFKTFTGFSANKFNASQGVTSRWWIRRSTFRETSPHKGSAKAIYLFGSGTVNEHSVDWLAGVVPALSVNLPPVN